MSKAIFESDLARHYATINVVGKLCRDEKVVSISICQNFQPHHYLHSGKVIAEAIARSDERVVLLASGALSHKYNQIDWGLKTRVCITKTMSRNPKTSQLTRKRLHC